MFKRGVHKKGVVQIDWVISLGIFLIYIVWFFIVVRPIISPASTEALPIEEMREAFLLNASWTVNQTPIILKSNRTINDVPIVVDFKFSGTEQTYGLKERYWSIHDNKLFFVASFPAKKQNILLLHSAENYSKPSITTSFETGDESSTGEKMIAFFDDALLEKITVNTNTKISDFKIEADGITFVPAKTVHSADKILSLYRMESDELNHTSYIIINNTRILNYLKGNDRHIKIKATLDEYDDYYISSIERGNINYNSSSCKNVETDYINFHDNEKGLTFVFSNIVDIEFCPNDDLDIEIDFDIDGMFNYNMIFHEEGGDTLFYKEEYTAEYGVKNTLNGISERNLFNIRNANYSDTQQEWGKGNNFNITIMNSSNNPIFDYGATPYQHANVKSRTYYVWVLDKYGNQSRSALNILSWK